MRLIYAPCNLTIDFGENEVAVLVLENAKDYTAFILDMIKQNQGEDGDIILSENSKILSLSKCSELILNPLMIDINSKKIQNKLYSELANIMEEEEHEKRLEIQSEIISIVDRICNKVPYPIIYEPDISALELLRVSQVKLEMNGSLLQRLSDYIRICSNLAGISLVIFVGLKQFLTEEEIMELYKDVFYSKVKLLLIESYEQKHLAEKEKTWVIDNQHCIINY